MVTNKLQPLQGIMKTAEYQDAVSFRVACDCHDNNHDVDVWIEVEKDDEVHEITVTFYRELDTHGGRPASIVSAKPGASWCTAAADSPAAWSCVLKLPTICVRPSRPV